MSLQDKLVFLLEEINSVQASSTNTAEVHLLLVTKSASLSQMQEAYDLGYRDFAESRVQALLEKKVQLPSDINWHFIGPLQSNKVNKIVGQVSLIHSVDSENLVLKIAERSQELGITSQILLQVNTSGEDSKQGFTEEGCMQAFQALKDLPGIEIKGLMTIAPLTQDAKIVRNCFARLRKLRDSLKLLTKNEGAFPYLSMGMSQDYKIAIEEGATHLRIGSLLFSKSDRN
ncbi:MAG: YggS family pyridoxal phosphate-dependent enzyme [Chlamydiae bacterium]|jgi:pyridoxal phosphate enzyme (YggS family)|nr:YggS family pyridoxal phosphate-dependent enzyme [Chlamydiota bacterium]